MSSQPLTSSQLRALFDILTHRETYAEVVSFREPQAITRYGFPFSKCDEHRDATTQKSAFPLLQLLLTQALLPAPGARELPREFWSVRVQGLMTRFTEAGLSETYDKQGLGTRKTLATAASVIHESVTRGMLGGVAMEGRRGLQPSYNAEIADEVIAAWTDGVHELIYGDLVDELFDHMTKTPNFEEHSPAIRTAVDYAIIHISTLLHQVFVLSPKGQYLRQLIESSHKLIPYSMFGQTLRVGNVAMMMNAMMKLLLGKASIGGFTNWMGLTQNAADGMNLLQRIISMVLSWDASEFRKSAEMIRKCKDRASDKHLAAIDDHMQSSVAQFDAVRQRSITSGDSIIVTILKARDPKLAKGLSTAQHAQLLKYYTVKLSVRDREKIIEAVCQASPDHFTAAVRDAITAGEPFIRAVHSNVDLRKHLGSIQRFIDDLIQTSKPRKTPRKTSKVKKEYVPPSVEDYVGLLRRNRHLLFDFIHDLCIGCPDIKEDIRGWLNNTMEIFRQDNKTHGDPNREQTRNGVTNGHNDGSSQAGAGAMSKALQSIFCNLPQETQAVALAALDSYAEYITELETISKARMQRIIDQCSNASDVKNGSMSGPGSYLSRWQMLMDEALITPAEISGPIRHGKDVAESSSSPEETGKEEEAKGSWDASVLSKQEMRELPQPPAVDVVWDALGEQFRDVVADISLRSIPKEVC